MQIAPVSMANPYVTSRSKFRKENVNNVPVIQNDCNNKSTPSFKGIVPNSCAFVDSKTTLEYFDTSKLMKIGMRKICDKAERFVDSDIIKKLIDDTKISEQDAVKYAILLKNTIRKKAKEMINTKINFEFASGFFYYFSNRYGDERARDDEYFAFTAKDSTIDFIALPSGPGQFSNYLELQQSSYHEASVVIDAYNRLVESSSIRIINTCNTMNELIEGNEEFRKTQVDIYRRIFLGDNDFNSSEYVEIPPIDTNL